MRPAGRSLLGRARARVDAGLGHRASGGGLEGRGGWAEASGEAGDPRGRVARRSGGGGEPQAAAELRKHARLQRLEQAARGPQVLQGALMNLPISERLQTDS